LQRETSVESSSVDFPTLSSIVNTRGETKMLTTKVFNITLGDIKLLLGLQGDRARSVGRLVGLKRCRTLSIAFGTTFQPTTAMTHRS
jgi:hypothetical protein